MTTKAEFVARLSAETGLSKKEALSALSAVEKLVYEDLASGEAVLPGLGKLKVKQRGERAGRNPRTGENLTIAARKVVKFVATSKLKQFVQGS
jgi:Bacterial nucleoid DNA-binding protein